jgi:excisionase family DNA binding protein
MMPEDRVPLFVRLPRQQAAALDRLAGSTGRHKQHLVSELLADRLEVGHLQIAEDPAGAGEEVLTLEEAGALLRLDPQAVLARARAGELPGRAFGEEWRFARSALLRWLARGERGQEPDRGDDPTSDDD